VFDSLIINIFSDAACDVTLSVYPHRASLKNMPEYITPTQKNHEYI
jgi:hypothetical protein